MEKVSSKGDDGEDGGREAMEKVSSKGDDGEGEGDDGEGKW